VRHFGPALEKEQLYGGVERGRVNVKNGFEEEWSVKGNLRYL
jgi:hypothetical protein